MLKKGKGLLFHMEKGALPNTHLATFKDTVMLVCCVFNKISELRFEIRGKKKYISLYNVQRNFIKNIYEI